MVSYCYHRLQKTCEQQENALGSPNKTHSLLKLVDWHQSFKQSPKVFFRSWCDLHNQVCLSGWLAGCPSRLKSELWLAFQWPMREDLKELSNKWPHWIILPWLFNWINNIIINNQLIYIHLIPAITGNRIIDMWTYIVWSLSVDHWPPKRKGVL